MGGRLKVPVRYAYLRIWGGNWVVPPFCSNYFVFQSYELSFSEIVCLLLIRSFPGSFMFGLISRWVPTTISKKIKNEITKSEPKKHISKMCGRMSPWVPQKSKDPGNRVFRSRQNWCPKRSSKSFLEKMLEHFVEAMKFQFIRKYEIHELIRRYAYSYFKCQDNFGENPIYRDF